MVKARGCKSAAGSSSCSVQAVQNHRMPMPHRLYRIYKICFFIVMLLLGIMGVWGLLFRN